MVKISIAPKIEGDREKLGEALRNLAAEDPTIEFSFDAESGEFIVGGASEPHIDGHITAIQERAAIGLDVGQPQVAYRESLGRTTEITYTHKKQTGGSGQFAEVKIIFEPGEPGSGYSFDSKIVGGTMPKEYIPGVEKGLLNAKENGLLAGFPVIDFKATLVDGKYHDVDSSVLAFEIAARSAFRELRDKAQPKLLEPIMKVEVTTPEDYVGDVIGDLNSRRGMIQGADQRGNAQVILAHVPLANMFGYVKTLRSMSQGRAAFHMEYDHYARTPAPPDDTFPSAMAMRA